MNASVRRVVHTLVSVCLLALMFGTAPRLVGQGTQSPALTPQNGQSLGFAVSTAVRDLPPDTAAYRPTDPDENMKTVQNRSIRPNASIEMGQSDGALSAPVIEPAAPALEPPGGAPAPFTGLSNQDNFNAFGFRVSPSDSDGDVGPNHYVAQVNLLVRVWDKSGTPLTAPFKLSTLFAPLGGQCAAPDQGDPIVLYDHLADRWILSQFAFVSLTAPPYFQCIAVSQTSDPAGAYFLYAFQTPGNEFPDYPKLGVWPDGYYMMVHQFTNGGPFNGTGLYSFDRVKMLAGNPSAGFIYFNLSLANVPQGIGGGLPADLDGLTPPPAGAPNLFAYFTTPQFADPAFGIRLFEFHADFANPASSTFIERPESTYASPIPVAPFSLTQPAGRRNIPQPSPTLVGNISVTQALDAIGERFMHRLQYRNFGTHQSLVVTHTVGAPGSTTYGTYRASPRTYELRNSGAGYSVNEQSTFAPGGEPGDAISRWMGSAAMDNQGNLAVAYSVSSGQAGGNVFPGLRYAGRLATDPPNGMFQGEQVLIDGSGRQTSTGNRWGDYSHLAVDPADDCTFWYTGQYYTAASAASSTVGWVTGIGNFKFTGCTPPQSGTVAFTVTDCSTSAPVPGASVSIGGMPYGATAADGTYEATLSPGLYDFSASRPPLYGSASGDFTVTDGATTAVSVCLNPQPFVTITKTADELVVPVGSPIGFTVTLSNLGGVTANGLAFTDDLPSAGGLSWAIGPGTDAGWSVAGAAPNQSLLFSGTTLAGLASTQAHVVSVTTPDLGGTHTNTASFTSADAGSGSATASVTVIAPICEINEGFNNIATLVPAGWFLQNNSRPGPGSTGWFQGNAASFPAHQGAANAYIGANFNNGTGLSTLSNWLLTPMVTLKNGSQFTFWTRRIGTGVAAFPDRLQVRMSTGGASTDVGTTATSVGDFTTLLLDINPTYSTATTFPAGYPAAFTQFTVTVSGLGAPTTGRLALRYFVENGGPSGANSNYIGIDTAAYNCSAVKITKTADAVSLIPGMPMGFRVTLANDDVVPATGLSFSDLLPAGFGMNWSIDVATTDPGWSVTGLPPNQRLVYSPTSLAGSTVTTAHVVSASTADSCGVHHNTASVSSASGAGSATASIGFVTTALAENFDGVVEPALPAGWTASQGANAGGFAAWATSSIGNPLPAADSAPNSAFSVDPANILDNRLDSTPIAVAGAATVTFRHRAVLETNFDGGVLEISLDGGPFVDILAAGGSFVTGGYNGTMSTAFGSPIAGRAAWTGTIGTTTSYVTVIANLPASAAGKTAVLRLRMGSDNAVSSQGWRIDNVAVVDTLACDPYAFTGFFKPISNTSVNEVKGGSNVPVKFSLGGFQGLSVLAALSPSSQQVHCTTLAPIGPEAATTGGGPGTLTYDAGSDRYQYNWKTDKSWAGTCRVLHVKLLDQTDHTATFKFK